MAKSDKKQFQITLPEILIFVSSFAYAHSVNTAIHHYNIGSAYEGRTAETPAMMALAIAIILSLYYWRKHKRLSILIAVSLAVFATASFIWLSGFRVNAG